MLVPLPDAALLPAAGREVQQLAVALLQFVERSGRGDLLPLLDEESTDRCWRCTTGRAPRLRVSWTLMMERWRASA